MNSLQESYKKRLLLLKSKKQELEEVAELKSQILEEEKAIKSLKPMGFFKRLFTKDEY